MTRGRVVLSRDERTGRVPYWCRGCGHHEIRTEDMRGPMKNNADYQLFKPTPGLSGVAHSPTPPDILGPFYKPGAPYEDCLHHLAEDDGHDHPVIKFSGSFTDTQGDPLDGWVELWQADPHGAYDNDGFKYRGKILVAGGVYQFWTHRPGNYEIQQEGKPKEVRPAHVHVILGAVGHRQLITQLYFPDDPYNETDPWFRKNAGQLTVDLRGDVARFDFVLEKI